MGANAQTSVPLYASGEILTAANMNISAGTGIPVFANTTTRDAAFGGTGEKVLAQGQLCYLEQSRQLLTYTGSSWINTSGNIGMTEANATTAIVSGTALSVLSFSPSIQPGRLHLITGRICVQMSSSNAASKLLYITSTPVTRSLMFLSNTVGANLPQIYQGQVLLTSTQLGVTSGNGTAVTISMLFRDSANSGALNTNPDGILGANTSPQQLEIQDIGSE